jgi:Family of unknown function (DUF6524)
VNGFLTRLAGTLVLVFATYNPSGHSFSHWALEGGWALTPAKAFAGVVLTIGWVLVFTSAWRSLGVIGTGLLGAFVATALWWALASLGAGLGARALTWLVLAAIALVLAAAMSASALRRRFGGAPGAQS